MRFPDAFVAEVKARTDLVRLVGERVTLRRAGREFRGLSPFQEERTPSFYVMPEKGFWHCFCTQRSGDCFEWRALFHGDTFAEAVVELAALAGLDLPADCEAPPAREKKAAVIAPVVVTRTAAEEAAEVEAERHKAFALWRSGLPTVEVAAVARYLADVRGLPEDVWGRIAVLRAGMATFWSVRRGDDGPDSLGEYPCLLGAIQGQDGRFAGIHMTYVEPDGSGKLNIRARGALPGERPKKVRGKPQGGAIRLAPAMPEMGGAEGIETALSCIAGTGLPVWSLYSRGNWAGRQLEPGPEHPERPGQRLPGDVPDLTGVAFLPPPIVRRFTWFADNDSKDALVNAAMVRRGAARLRAIGLVADVAWPPEGMDFNDVWRAGQSAAPTIYGKAAELPAARPTGRAMAMEIPSASPANHRMAAELPGRAA